MGQTQSKPTPKTPAILALRPGRGIDQNESVAHYQERIDRHLERQRELAAALEHERQQHAAEEQPRQAQGQHNVTFDGMPETPLQSLMPSLTLNLHTIRSSLPPERAYDGREAVEEDDEEAPVPEAFEEPREDDRSDFGDEDKYLEESIDGGAIDGMDRTLTSDTAESRAATTPGPYGSRGDQEMHRIVSDEDDLIDSVEGGATDTDNANMHIAVATTRAAPSTKAAASSTEEEQSSSGDKVDHLQSTANGGATVETDMRLPAENAPSRAVTTATAPDSLRDQEQGNNAAGANTGGAVDDRTFITDMNPTDAPGNARAREAGRSTPGIWWTQARTGAQALQYYNDRMAELRDIAEQRRNRKRDTTPAEKDETETPLQKKQKLGANVQDNEASVSKAPRRSGRLKTPTRTQTERTGASPPAHDTNLINNNDESAAASSRRRAVRSNSVGERPRRSPPALPTRVDDSDARRATSGRPVRSAPSGDNRAAIVAARRSTSTSVTPPVARGSETASLAHRSEGTDDEANASRNRRSAAPSPESQPPHDQTDVVFLFDTIRRIFGRARAAPWSEEVGDEADPGSESDL